MKCEIPNCSNESFKKISKTGIFYGVYVDEEDIFVCDKHNINEINDCINKICTEKAIANQVVNPFAEIENFKKKTNFR